MNKTRMLAVLLGVKLSDLRFPGQLRIQQHFKRSRPRFGYSAKKCSKKVYFLVLIEVTKGLGVCGKTSKFLLSGKVSFK